LASFGRPGIIIAAMRAATVFLFATIATVATVMTVALPAQGSKTYKARLSPVPIDVSMQATVSGVGAASAVLTGARLVVTGSFEGLKSPATIAKIHKGPARGVRGPEVFDLNVSRGAGGGTAGTLEGTFELTPVQLSDLERGRLYVQVHSEKAPEGNLWGWLLPQEKR
jgi:hypothetical protein